MEKKKILFVCLGNICRSPAAEGIMKHQVEQQGLADQFCIDSAGIGSWHVGQLPDPRMRQHGKAHGYNFNSHARQIQRDDFDRFDYIIVMDDENLYDVQQKARNTDDRQKIIKLASFLQQHPGQKTVPDPYYGGDKDFELVIELLEDACDGLLRWLLKG
jgi:protein-tyrosine phosphatase